MRGTGSARNARMNKKAKQIQDRADLLRDHLRMLKDLSRGTKDGYLAIPTHALLALWRESEQVYKGVRYFVRKEEADDE